jgi:hypothetical protein
MKDGSTVTSACVRSFNVVRARSRRACGERACACGSSESVIRNTRLVAVLGALLGGYEFRLFVSGKEEK